MFRVEHNVETGEITEIELTDKEIKLLETERKENEAAEKKAVDEYKVKAVAKAALLAQLGITEEQAKLLLS